MHPLPNEIIVVDNGSKDGTAFYVRNRYPNVTIIEYSEKLRSDFARLRGAIQASCDLVAFLEDDILVPNDWLGRMLSVFEDDHVGIAGSIIQNDDGSTWEPVVKTTCFGDKVWRISSCSDGWAEIRYANESGTIMRKTLLDVGLIDPGLIGDAWGESISLYTRIRRRGIKAICVPITLLHFPTTPGGNKERYQKGRLSYYYSLYTNKTYVYLKYQATSALIIPAYLLYRFGFLVVVSLIQKTPKVLSQGYRGTILGLRLYLTNRRF